LFYFRAKLAPESEVTSVEVKSWKANLPYC